VRRHRRRDGEIFRDFGTEVLARAPSASAEIEDEIGKADRPLEKEITVLPAPPSTRRAASRAR
jgi:hypothetical protein